MAGKTDSSSIRVPYRNLREVEVEMMGTDGAHHQIDLNSSSSSSPKVLNGTGDLSPPPSQPRHKHNTLTTLILSCTVAASVQFSWALQLSLLTPCIQVRF
ncbi:unnamed protein product [Prunus armeniaca]|uniref:Uncharacterized protein n=1 Tax=Prunus armeniaca TaxID=36596 RepID=A0A6J5X3M1_PRUAR|nr:hypothetical protein GBA52_014606 [Prunus armeniaca]CAB4308626.1 unnamed protein product [Prunus armeniaca]